MSYLALSDSFEYLCYASTVIINIFYFYCVGIWESDVYRRQILTTKVYPRAVRVNVFLKVHVVASELKDPICHSNECQIGSFSSEATMYIY